jgi:hypothetical protein
LSEAGDGDGEIEQEVAEVMGRGLAFHIRAEGEDDFVRGGFSEAVE